MKKLITLAIMASGALYASSLYAKNIETSLGVERYRETYREYEPNGERIMQQRGGLSALSAGVKYRLNDQNAIKVEGRYAKGKINYTGGYNPDIEEGSEPTPYGSLQQKGAPRRSYDIRSSYVHEYPIRPNVSLVGEMGAGYRVLKDLSTKLDPDDADRTNKTAYVQMGIGAKIGLANGLEFAPKINYNHGVYGRQYTYIKSGTVNLKQYNARGIEVELPINQYLPNKTQISYSPYYRGWRVPISNIVERPEQDDSGEVFWLDYKEPKNYTHEAGFKLQYTF